MPNRLLFALSSLTLVATPTLSQPKASGQAAQKVAQASAEKTYCLKFADDTGSHLARTECKTKKEWRSAGVEIDAMLGN